MTYKFNIDIFPDTSSMGSILCHTKNGRFLIMSLSGIFASGWDWKAKKYNIDWWAYCEDIEFMLKEWERITDGL